VFLIKYWRLNMNNPSDIKEAVKEKYSEIAVESLAIEDSHSGCGCGSSCGCNDEELYNFMSAGYVDKDGYVPDADLGLGCGVPTDYANIKNGDKVLDLGSGAGIDAFIISKIVGDSGKVVGLDMTKAMIEKAETNKAKYDVGNIDFILGEIEEMPLNENTFDVVVSNCVINLVPDKAKAFSEIHRVLKPGGSFCISDIVLNGVLPEKFKSIVDFYTGCIAGAIQENDYYATIKSAGFDSVSIHKKKEVEIADDVLMNYLSKDEVEDFIKTGASLYSVTVSAKK
jgi:arsenite methyltransferase